MLGENIKTYRQKKGYTQEEVANRLHVTRQTISKWEKNYSVPDAEVFVKLADVLEVQTSQLLEVKVDSDVQTTEEKQNAYAEQLAHIAEQMAIRNRQRKRIWKTIGIAFAVHHFRIFLFHLIRTLSPGGIVIGQYQFFKVLVRMYGLFVHHHFSLCHAAFYKGFNLLLAVTVPDLVQVQNFLHGQFLGFFLIL